MRILSKYITLEFSKLVGWLLLTFSCIYLVADMSRIEGFLKDHAAASDIASYYLFKIPLIIFQTMPIAILLAVMFTFGGLIKHNELTAMKSSGISVYQAVWPVISVAVALSALTFLFNEHVIPYTNGQMEYVRRVKIKKEKPKGIFQENNIWYRGQNNMFYNFKTFASAEKLKGVVIYKLDDRFLPVYRADAAAMSWQAGRWVLADGALRQFGPEGLVKLVTQAEMVLPDIKEKPEDFSRLIPLPETMNYTQLKKYIDNLEDKGYSGQRYVVDLYAKFSLPFVNLVMALIGIPFSLKLNRNGGWAVGFGLSIALGFGYWVLLSMGLAMGHGGALPPVVAVWGTNVLFGLAGTFMLTRIKQ